MSMSERMSAGEILTGPQYQQPPLKEFDPQGLGLDLARPEDQELYDLASGDLYLATNYAQLRLNAQYDLYDPLLVQRLDASIDARRAALNLPLIVNPYTRPKAE